MLKWRLILGASFIALLVVLCWLDAQADRPGMQPGLPGAALMPVLLLLTVLATQEVLRLAAAAGIRPVAWPIYAGNVLLVLAQWFPEVNLYVLRRLVQPGTEFGYLAHVQLIHATSHSALWAMALAVLMIFAAEMQRYELPGGTLVKIAVGIFGLVYVGLMFTFAVQIRLFWGVGAFAAWIISVKMGDIGAYTVGRLIGRTKMATTISPGKTMEGAVGAIVFALIGSWIGFQATTLPWSGGPITLPSLVQLAPPYAEGMPGTAGGWVIFGLLMAVVGMLGDLAESLLKRDVGCKDSSNWLPGFGGVLDILDSLLLSAPIAWLCWSMGIVGPGGG